MSATLLSEISALMRWAQFQIVGKPCIKGSRITVELILRKLGAGRSFADLLEAYPQLTEDDLRAALAFAADYMQHETVLAAE
jgi:uncharacterized protein (DUF433 family)